jgi:hypothetical protein
VAYLKVENLAQTTFMFSPIRYRIPRFDPSCVVILINEPSKLILLATIYVVSTFPLTLLALRAIITSLSLGKSYRQLIYSYTCLGSLGFDATNKRQVQFKTRQLMITYQLGSTKSNSGGFVDLPSPT